MSNSLLLTPSVYSIHQLMDKITNRMRRNVTINVQYNVDKDKDKHILHSTFPQITDTELRRFGSLTTKRYKLLHSRSIKIAQI